MNQPLAYVHPGAKIAKNVVVEPFTTISNNVEIGEGTWVGSNVTIMEGARIGNNCFIYPGSVISAIPQDLKFEGEDSLCKIGNNTTSRGKLIFILTISFNFFVYSFKHLFVCLRIT